MSACPPAARPFSFTPAIEADLKELAVVLCLGAKEANDIRSDVAGSLYKRLLREEVTSRRIDAAASPAQVCVWVQAVCGSGGLSTGTGTALC